MGFTLIELLVVIAILISILMPQLDKVRRKTQRAVCLSNQNQISKAFMLFAKSNNARLPSIGIPGRDNPSGTAVQLYYWQREMAEELKTQYLGSSIQVFDCPEWQRKNVLTQAQWEKGISSYPNLYRTTNYISGTSQRLDPEEHPGDPKRDIDGDGYQDDLMVKTSRDEDSTKMLLGDVIFETTFGVYTFSDGAPHIDNGKPAGGNFIFLNGSGKWKYSNSLKSFYSYSGSLNDHIRDFYWWTSELK